MIGDPGGGAVMRPKMRTSVFADPAWEERFDALIQLTPRTTLIRDLLGIDIRPARLKSIVDTRLQELGMEAMSRPRGCPGRYDNRKFLGTRGERFEAALLLAMHFGPRGAHETARAPTLQLGPALDHKIAVYTHFRSVAVARGQEPRVTFESYIHMLDGLRAGALEVRACKACSSRYPVSTATMGEVPCPICATLGLGKAGAGMFAGSRADPGLRLEPARRTG